MPDAFQIQSHDINQTKPLTFEDLRRALEDTYRKQTPPPEYPKQFLDIEKAREHGIKMGFDPLANTWMMSPSERRRAKEVGAIWTEDKDGNRLP